MRGIDVHLWGFHTSLGKYRWIKNLPPIEGGRGALFNLVMAFIVAQFLHNGVLALMGFN
jgi:hypothetical protein